MKRITITLVCVTLLAWSLPGQAAMTVSEVRNNARFLSDRMAYELNLSTNQYADVYEINYDFLSSVRFVMDGVIRGNERSTDRYYEYMDIRDEDLSYVLSRQQYLEYLDTEYFCNPLYTDQHIWQLRVYGVYPNTAYFYFAAPLSFYTYSGLHSRLHYRDGFYQGRYHHELYRGPLPGRREPGIIVDRKPSRYEPVRPGGRYDRSPAGTHLHGNDRPNAITRPDRNDRSDRNNRPNVGHQVNQRPNAGQNVRPDNGQNNRPNNNQQARPNENRNNRPDNGQNQRPNSSQGNRFNSGNTNRPGNNNNARPSQNNENSSRQQVRSNNQGNSRSAQTVRQSTKENTGKNARTSSTRTNRERSESSRR